MGGTYPAVYKGASISLFTWEEKGWKKSETHGVSLFLMRHKQHNQLLFHMSFFLIVLGSGHLIFMGGPEELVEKKFASDILSKKNCA